MTMLFPPSLSPEIRARAFHAVNGELGLLPEDAMAFLDACHADDVEVLGWDLWLVDHAFYAAAKAPIKAAGSWCGFIPLHGDPLPAVVAGSGDLAATREQIGRLDLNRLVEAPWRPYVRVNVTLAD